MNAQIETLPTDLPRVNQDVLLHWLGYVASVIAQAVDLDHAEAQLQHLAAGQNMFVYRGGDHLALHMFSGHPARMLFVTKGPAFRR